MVGYIIFAAGIDDVYSSVRCTAIVVLLQFFFLTTWFWMCTYSYDVYRGLITVSNLKNI